MTTTTTDVARTNGRSPTHIAYHVRDVAGRDKGFWTRIGSAWAHADGQGLSIQLECAPVDGRISLRTVSERGE